MSYNFPFTPIVTTEDEARDCAIAWQSWQSEQSLSYSEMLEWQSYFSELGRKYNLTEEYQENGIL